jgi:hypothetical protein
MMSKTYKTAQGKLIDMQALRLQNEQVRAVGNMGVNARGDRLDSQNRVIERKVDKSGKRYESQIGNVTDEPVAESSKKSTKEPLTAPEPVTQDPFATQITAEKPTTTKTPPKDDGFSLT